jgi:hypothetical protein
LPENAGGGRVATLVIGPKFKPGYRSTAFYQYPSVLKTMIDEFPRRRAVRAWHGRVLRRRYIQCHY